MGKAVWCAAVDLGSSSGRVVAGRYDGQSLALHEVHRFAQQIHDSDGALLWDLDSTLDEVRHGLSLATAVAGGDLVGVAVDTWGVDHVLLRSDGSEILPVHSYRDPRTNDVPELLDRQAPPELLWDLTGVQPAPINTTHQLVASLRDRPALREEIDAVLMLPDYVAHRLGAERGWSRAICSTSGLCRTGAAGWSTEVMALLDLDGDWFGDIGDERTELGRLMQHPRTRIVRGGSHDTACAVHALPRSTGNRAFLSSGSWSLVGVELDEASMGREVQRAGLTNEVRTDGGVRLLKNLTGLWILQECQRQWRQDGSAMSIGDLVEEARHERSLGVVFDPAHPDFATPGDMADRVAAHLRDHVGRRPGSRGQLVRVVIESLAVAYARSVAELARLTPVEPDHVVVVGGGTRNDLLSEMTAVACDLPVVLGAAEASATGSILAQLQTLGHLAGPDDLWSVLEASAPTTVIEPGDADPAARGLVELSQQAVHGIGVP